VASFGSAADSPVELAIAGALDEILPDATDDMSEVLGSFQLSAEDEIDDAFESMGPSLYDAVSRATADAARAYANGLQYRMDNARLASGSAADGAAGEKRNLGLWTQLLGQWSNRDRDDSYTGYDQGAKGLIVGADLERDLYFFGGAVGFLNADVVLDQGLGRGDSDHAILSGYAGWTPGRGFAQTSLSYGRGSYDTLRNLRVGPLRRKATGEYDGSLWSWSIKGGYSFPLRDWTLEPFGFIDWLRTDEDPLEESGAGDADLIVDGRTRDWWGGGLGLRVFGGFPGEHGRFHPEFQAAWNRVFDCGDCDLSIAYAGAPGVVFDVPGRDPNRDGALVGAGVVYFGRKGWNAGARFNAVVTGDLLSYGLVGEFRYRF
jgi:outer membrane autotransporter protein